MVFACICLVLSSKCFIIIAIALKTLNTLLKY